MKSHFECWIRYFLLEFAFYTSAHITHFPPQKHKDDAAMWTVNCTVYTAPCFLLLNIFPYKRILSKFVKMANWSSADSTHHNIWGWELLPNEHQCSSPTKIKIKSIDVAMLFHFINSNSNSNKVQCVPLEFIFLWLFYFNMLLFNRGMDDSFSREGKNTPNLT